MTRLWPWIFAGLCLAGIAHIVSILAMPSLSKSDATSRLFAVGPTNHLTMLPRTGPGAESIPFSDPNVALAICPFDIGDTPLRIKVAPGQEYLTIAFLQPGGSIFYSLSDKANPNGALDIRLVNAAELQKIEADDPDDQPVTELRVTAPTDKGIALIRALASDAGEISSAEQRIARATCAAEALR